MKKIIFLGLLLVVNGCFAVCDKIRISIDNQFNKPAQLQSSNTAPVIISAHHQQSIDIELATYKEKFCSVVSVSFDEGRTASIYVIKPKQKSFRLSINKVGQIDVDGLTGPLTY